ncbi:tetratricopeptide repeat protein [Flavobacterium sp. RSSB_23]|jgi:tetratricopeptide (TPR) repeat protein|uniref:tetratricopeptide repeat protein n=1 Tax=Flavobacterium sp. RSSB_23 TaxID=3447668 RepID=UPI003F359A4F
MNVTDYTFLINKPDTINSVYTDALGNILNEFPYFQSARALRLKGLFNQNSFKYNYALKVTAAHTTDRSILFDFITSEHFDTIQNDLYDKKNIELMNMEVVDSEIVHPKTILEQQQKALELSILTSIKEATNNNDTISENESESVIELGKPIDFTPNEKHSFQEWLQLSRTQPIDRSIENNSKTFEDSMEEERKKKAALIDKFIETNPKIAPIKPGSAPAPQFELNSSDNTHLMTETLARVYLEQKKYQKAIQAYEILILKYPEKSSFFADHISEIRNLQNNNN